MSVNWIGATPGLFGRAESTRYKAVPIVVGFVLVAIAFAIYFLSNRLFNAGRGDFFYLADAFLHGRTWLDHELGVWDDVLVGSRVYVPFAPFPALAFMPLVAIVGPATADSWQPILNAGLAAIDVGLCWVLMGRVGVRSLVSRFFLVVLFGFSTSIWWVTTRGGVWHTGHLTAVLLTLGALIELFGQRRAWLIGLLGGAAFLSRTPLLFALPAYALLLWLPEPGGETEPQPAVQSDGSITTALWNWRQWPLEDWLELAVGAWPSIAFFFWYNYVRFGSPFESGYALATLPQWLADLRANGLFSVDHLGMNLDYLLWHLPKVIDTPPFFRPDGFGLSIFITSPGLLVAIRANWLSTRAVLIGTAALAVLIPNLLYYGGGWLQFGYRYALDAVPFVMVLAGMAVARHGLGWTWRLLIGIGVLVNLAGVYWAYNIH